MRKSLRFSSLFLGSVLLTILVQGQSDRFAYAITDVQKDGANWSFLRKLNLQNGKFSDVLLSGGDTKLVAYDAVSKQALGSFESASLKGINLQPAFSTGVAAMAYDKKNNRLWFTPMFIDQLRYIDLKTMKVYYVTSGDFTGMAQKSADQGNIVTRMTMGSDGNGYAMTNDGANLIRFTTGKDISITNLGMMVDAPESKGVSVHSSCSSFGGDMIADNEGNLYVFSARNYIFKINIESKVATHVGIVSGLPTNFTTNGAVVTTDNKIVIGSAVDATSYYTVDPKTWAATPMQLETGWRSSDLANSNILNTNKSTKQLLDYVSTNKLLPAIAEKENNQIQVYPNPVPNDQFVVQFGKLDAGDYTIQLTDVMGRQIMQRVVNVTGEDQSETIKLSPASARGFYLVKVLDKTSKSVFTRKLIVQ